MAKVVSETRKSAPETRHNMPIRPRSLYTAHTHHGKPEENNFQRVPDFAKFFEPPSDQWSPLSAAGAASPAVSGQTQFASPVAWTRGRSSAPPKPLAPGTFYQPEDYGSYDGFREVDEMSAGAGAVATPYGTISLRLHDRVRVDLTLDRAIRLINFKNSIVLALSGSGASAALLHPNGRVYQYGSRVEILANETHGNCKYAKMWYKGVSFTSEQCALVYLVDAAGTRTTTDNFSDLTGDFSLAVFYSDSRHGPAYVQECLSALQGSQYWATDDGVENWIINNVRVSQTQDGLVRVARSSNKYLLRTSPSNGTASITSPFLHCTASMGQTSHLFVRRGERRMHYDGTSFIVRNAGHSAGFDEKNQLKVY